MDHWIKGTVDAQTDGWLSNCVDVNSVKYGYIFCRTQDYRTTGTALGQNSVFN